MNVTRNEFTEAQRKWIAALRSGEYRQTVDAFCDGYGYCCLAVATHSLNPDDPALVNNGWDAEFWRNGPQSAQDPEWFSCLEPGQSAPPNVVDALCLNASYGDFRFNVKIEGQRGLWGLNDNAQWSFNQIADLIEAKPWLVFTNFDMPSAEVTE